MRDFKAGDLVEELDPLGIIDRQSPLPSGIAPYPRAQGLIVRVCPPDEHPGFHNRQVVEVQWLATGHQTLQFNGNLRRVKR